MGLAYSVLGGPGMGLHEVATIGQKLQEVIDPDAQVIFGAAIDPDLGDEIIVTLIATGFAPPPPPPVRLRVFDLFEYHAPVQQEVGWAERATEQYAEYLD